MRKAFTDFEFAGFINPICLIENLQNGPLNGAMVQIILKFRRDSWKQQIYSIISISLTAWFFGPKILSANNKSDSFTGHISRMVWLFDFIFYMTVQYYNWSQWDKFCLLIGFGILLGCVLKSCLLTKLSKTYLLIDNVFIYNIIV